MSAFLNYIRENNNLAKKVVITNHEIQAYGVRSVRRNTAYKETS